jgi:hypothetical protein
MLSSVTPITLKKSGTSTLVANLGGQAMSPKFWEITRRIHHNVEIALAAILFAFVIYLTIFVIPKIPEIQAQFARVRAQEISAENAWLCENLNIKRGTDKYGQCLLHVGQFRLRAEKRVYDENDW